ncbi:alpha/beta fold hydrolase [Dactylosporangium sp. NPDC049140]|uniref:alpha/beta fold hydrolase n=1 Tax=Dactylosporangium sp. NPDC049140 TaxID=3155647 RepID=UPI00340CA3F2
MTVSDQEIISRFPVGYHELHPNLSLNFQMNRFYGWANEQQMLDEMRAAGKRIKTYDDWTREMLQLSDQAVNQKRAVPAAYYSRGAQFFLQPDDSRFDQARKRFLDGVESAFGVTEADKFQVPFQKTQLAAYRLTPDKPRGTIVIFGGYDSYIAEWLPAAIALRDAGLDTVIFDGPGQGMVLDAGVPMTPDWHLPVGAVLDYFKLDGVTLMGFSLGGCLVVRAAAREPRVARVVAWDVFTDLHENASRALDAVGLETVEKNAEQIPATALNAAIDAVSKSDLLTEWTFNQGKRVMGVDTPSDVFKAWDQYHTDDVSSLVKQDILLMVGTKDHYVPLHQLGDQVMTLTAAPSVTCRVFTEEEQAQNHCQVGNTGLAISVILNWLDQVGGRKG